MGIFKRFRASMTFSINTVDETTPLNMGGAVYRPYSEDLYSPGYRFIDEGSNVTATPAQKITVAPQTNSRPLTNSAATPGTSSGNTKTNKTDKKKDKKDDKKGKEKVAKKDKDKKTKVNKTKDVDKKKNKKTKTAAPVASVTIDRAAVESVQNQSAPRTDQPSGTTSQPPSAPQPTPAARSQAPANSGGNISPPPPYTFEKVDVKPKSRNPLAATNTAANSEDSQPDNNSGFSSSWDQVAMHRQNLHKELLASKSQQPNSLRSMMNQNKETENKGPSNRYESRDSKSKKRGSYHSSMYDQKTYNDDSGSEAEA